MLPHPLRERLAASLQLDFEPVAGGPAAATQAGCDAALQTPVGPSLADDACLAHASRARSQPANAAVGREQQGRGPAEKCLAYVHTCMPLGLPGSPGLLLAVPPPTAATRGAVEPSKAAKSYCILRRRA